MKRLPRAFCFGAITMMAACGLFIPKETRYLMSAKNPATQAEVTEKIESRLSPG